MPHYDDPPDDGIMLKKMRVPIVTAIWILTPLEQLCMTPSEALKPNDGDALSSIPAVTQKQGPGAEVEEYTGATSAEARSFKQRAIALGPKGLERTLDGERAAVLFRTSRGEAKMVAYLYRELEDLSRRKGPESSWRIISQDRRMRGIWGLG
ncbi:hypothetical protein OEA41_005652 [Lepraria neglecta]|uniref:Uncharacterized protein n=1 Tax=Lepraria neglecta TaxID=209136 RepID=A0AAE0DJX9_9LECA|nr:hypothetical protein OEA41_005652 [Lepraria neglecta]